ncbi:MAG: 2-amino-4-hydroxy-6-hydroxymethyldihydropteridine diphosphokinase [Thermodesulfobacteriota bacterium]
MKINKVVIGVGSNIEPDKNIQDAKRALARRFNILKSSSLIETEPIGYLEQDNFLNCAFLIETEMDSKSLKQWLQNLEKNLGRVPKKNKYGPRTIDLDIVIWNDEVVDRDVYERDFLKNSVNEVLPELKI